MKCDLCKNHSDGNLLCGDCTGMIKRLVAIESRSLAREVCETGRLAFLTEATSSSVTTVG